MGLLQFIAQKISAKRKKLKQKKTGPEYCTCKKYTPISLRKGSINYACSKCGKPPKTMVFGG
jgi:hypothetical protein